MALSFDFRLAVLVALFLFGAWASQAAAQDRPMKFRAPPYQSGMDSGDETKTETPVVSSSPAAPTTTTTPPVQSSASIAESANRIKDTAEVADSIAHSGTNGKAMFTHTMIFIAIIIALSHATI
ncbi:PREDICTED: uncharacterized protein LOC109153952 [Ipomoea nil]|uniref:uncharacterized protein LOC109153952 n=1 Tax=Ipomoea nil TaxID=35883 RepID=UPI000901351B|nr:PREDICTED: uncharacterized protein LOC109153952 [Ipomoea nil]